MASPSTAKLLLLRRLSRALKSLESPSLSCIKRSSAYSPACFLEASKRALDHPVSPCSRSFCSPPTSLKDEGPATIDYRSLLQEDEFHKLADSTIQDLLEKLEEYGDSTDIDGFDIDYGNHVLTLKLGTLGTYVLNKQTPNRQIWLSSPVSGPSRFDWDRDAQAWIYRRTKVQLLQLLEKELRHLCGQPINLS
ncbi:frataxin, mitochondrial isoform X2 [Diospyros lotus]|uniref:frataxin, mitochondrial isoform X2 n=1 Tax=Diospyros lotus TaxID=55363 RepID=UPI00225371CB|nr:frataxin, mitochondrial isoform X2 [Diospyros lotus]